MRAKHALITLAVAVAMSGCTADQESATSFERNDTVETLGRGTVPPVYQAGELEPGVDVVRSIPLEDLSTSGPAVLDEYDPCASIPDEVAGNAGFDVPATDSVQMGCFWTGPQELMIASFPPYTMAEMVARHRAMATGGDPLAHLAWLRIEGHHAFERIRARDPGMSCWLTVDVGAPEAVYVVVHRPESEHGTPTDLDTALDQRCSAARQVARALLRHLDAPESDATPTLPSTTAATTGIRPTG